MNLSMDVFELFQSCKKGDYETVRILVEQKDVDVNIRDRWDSTPLLFETGEYSDATFIVHGEKFRLHRCVLAARSDYFREMLTSKWYNRQEVVINNKKVVPRAFGAVMHYIYTGRFECPMEMIDICSRIAANCRLPNFRQKIQESLKKVNSLHAGKQGLVRVTTLVIEPDANSNAGGGTFGGGGGGGGSSEGANQGGTPASDLRDLAQQTLPPHLRLWPTEMPFNNPEEQLSLADVCFVVEGQPFMCHKMFFCPRSEYFRALLRDHFQEATWQQGAQDRAIPTVTLNEVSVRVFAIIVHYLYCNQTMVSNDNVLDVMVAADMYLLPGLKRQCGVFLGQRLEVQSVVSVIRVARMFQLPRLEDQCVAFMAKHLDSVLELQELQDLIMSDACEVEGRQETDTVTIIDEIRYHVSSQVCTISEIHEAKNKLAALERLLEDLDLKMIASGLISDICPICKEAFADTDNIVKIDHKGADGINAASAKREDSIAVTAGCKVHPGCHKWYINKRDIENQKKKDVSSSNSVKMSKHVLGGRFDSCCCCCC
ncbi:ankyrin repeat and BTB/POZ domain-containing protein 1-like isoform X2 [Oratosquilla oratoria]|uniref:ankyrin repeat and BTB/POZ domain-containing protein 1-like isoform X2 n=1 Tax=Oratosquilla oratoria TaxID=337810 RepID=UPI003F777FBE